MLRQPEDRTSNDQVIKVWQSGGGRGVAWRDD